MEMLDRLDLVRHSMAMAKNTKLLRKWNEKGDYNHVPVQTLIDNTFEEWEEFAMAIDPGTDVFYFQARFNIRVEIIDLVNSLEMLWDALELDGAW